MGRSKTIDAYLLLIMRLVEGYGEARSKAATHRERARVAKEAGDMTTYANELRLSDEWLGKSARTSQMVRRNTRNAIEGL